MKQKIKTKKEGKIKMSKCDTPGNERDRNRNGRNEKIIEIDRNRDSDR